MEKKKRKADLKAMIAAKKSEAKKRANKKYKSVSGDRTPSVASPSQRKNSPPSSPKLPKFKLGKSKDDPYSDYEPGDWGSDTDLGDFEDASWFGEDLSDVWGDMGDFSPGFSVMPEMGLYMKKGGPIKGIKRKKGGTASILLDTETDETEDKPVKTVDADSVPRMEKIFKPGTKKGGGLGLGTLLSIAMKVAPMMAGAPPLPVGFKEGGQIKSKVKKRKSKRVVRGVGAAKRGYGKATYSKKMY